MIADQTLSRIVTHRSPAVPDSSEVVSLPAIEGTYRRLDSPEVSLEDRVHRALAATGRRELAGVRIIAEGDRVTLTGRVPTYYMKQLAEHAAMCVEGISRVIGQLEVR